MEAAGWPGATATARRGTAGLFAEFERALVKLAPRHAGHVGDFANGVFQRHPRQRRPQQAVSLAGARLCHGRRRPDDQHDLAAPLAVGGILRQRRQVAAPDFLVQLGELAADRGLPRAEPAGEVGQRCSEPWAGLEQNQRRRNPGQLGNAGAPGALLGRQEAGEEKLIGRQTGRDQGRKGRRSAGQRRDREAAFMRRAHQLESRVRNQRRAGIGDQRNRTAGGKALQQRRARLFGVVFVVGCERRRDDVAVEQLPGDAGVFAGDHVGSGECLQRPQRNVAEIADRRCDDMKPGRGAWNRDDAAAKTVASRTILGIVWRGGHFPAL